MTFTAEFILSLAAALASGGGVYAAIRADLAALHERTQAANERLVFIEERMFKK